jgi:predicted nucleic acid-binding protein
MRLCLDTSAYSHFQRGHDEVVALIDSADWLGVPSIVLGELRAGFSLGSRQRENEAMLRSFLANPSVHELTVDGDVSHQYADIVVALRKAGTPIPGNDVWIAATAARQGATVLTFDEHYRAVARVGSIVLGA